MTENNPQCIEFIKSFLNGIQPRKKDTALEIACGEGFLSAELLTKEYKQVDAFD